MELLYFFTLFLGNAISDVSISPAFIEPINQSEASTSSAQLPRPPQTTSPLTAEKLANQNTQYLPVVPLVRGPRGSMLGIYGPDGHLFTNGLAPPPPPPYQLRKTSTEKMPWVERFHAYDASGSHNNVPTKDFNRLLKHDDTRNHHSKRLSVYWIEWTKMLFTNN